MKKIIIGILVVMGAGAAYWLIAPLFITKEANESLEDIIQQEQVKTLPQKKAEELVGQQIVLPEEQEPQIETIAEGRFEGLAGHAGSGTATLLKIGESYYVRFEENFAVTNGPDLFVYLGHDGEYAGEARLDSLKGNIGSQNYKIPDSIDIAQYNEVWVWCRAFSVPFAKAEFVTVGDN